MEFLHKSSLFYTRRKVTFLPWRVRSWDRKDSIQIDLLRNSLHSRGCFHCWGLGLIPGQQTKICKPRGTATPFKKKNKSYLPLASSQSWVIFPCWPPFAQPNIRKQVRFFFNLYLFLAALPCGLSLVVMEGLLIAVASLAMEHGPRGGWASVVVSHGLSCPTASGIFPDQGSNRHPLRCKAGS